MRIPMRVSVLLLAVCVVSLNCAAENATPGGQEMPSALYQSLKAHMDVLYGTQTNLLPGIAAPDKKAAEQALREDATANKASLIAALSSPKAVQREMAARALEYCREKKSVVSALCNSVQHDEDENTRRASAVTLAKLADAASVDALLAGLNDHSDGVRGLCATALGQIKDNRASNGLLGLLQHESKPLIRLQAALALSKIADPKTQEPLQESLKAKVTNA